jgi:3-oxoacyl-[acyl-carrier protein] reductase
MQALSGRRAIVTGAGRGIGRAIAMALAAEGAGVVLAARTRGEIEAAAVRATKEGGKAWSVPADVSDEVQVRALVGEAVSLMGGVDILVNNAGIGVFKPVVELRPEEMDRMWQVNVRGVFLMSREVLPVMTRQKLGDIVTISSLAGKNTFAGGAGYAATKWALRGFMGSLMLEVRQHNIRCVTVFPGSVDTTFSHQNQRGPHITQPEDVARAVLFALSSEGRTMVSEIDLRPTNPQQRQG